MGSRRITMAVCHLDELVQAQKRGEGKGLPSICSAHKFVLRTAIRSGIRSGKPVLIEATCNQVNQYGGYTGMTPAAFYKYVSDIANKEGLPQGQLILGGDHLGPSVWQNEPAERAMQNAEVLVHEYVKAGFSKIHLDTSMYLGGDPATHPLDKELASHRTARLARIAEETWADQPDRPAPRYVIGTEVPTPGGALQHDDQILVTSPAAVRDTIEAIRQAFNHEQVDGAWERVFALVVQPGVEFGDEFIQEFNPAKAALLSKEIEAFSNMVYEAHSTDYQSTRALRELVQGHFAILKVGPALTFAFREMVFSLAMIENELYSGHHSAYRSNIVDVIEAAMQKAPKYWRDHYRGTPERQALARKYSFSDRVRYYWNDPNVESSLNRLLINLGRKVIPYSLLSQFTPIQYERIRQGLLQNSPETLIVDRINSVLQNYIDACEG